MLATMLLVVFWFSVLFAVAAMRAGWSWLLLLHKPKALSITANSMKPARPHARLEPRHMTVFTHHFRFLFIRSKHTLLLMCLYLISSSQKCGTDDIRSPAKTIITSSLLKKHT